MVDRQEDHQMKTNATTVSNEGSRLVEFLKVKIVFTDSYIGKKPQQASLMFLINPTTTNVGQHSWEASENISAMVHTLIYRFWTQRVYQIV